MTLHSLFYTIALRDFYERNGRVYVGKVAFLRCWGTIKPWINIQSLMGHLMKNGLVNSSDDMEAISSGMLPASTRDKNLHDLLQANGGGNGYFFFYMSLCESLESNPLGHGDAVDELERAGEYIVSSRKLSVQCRVFRAQLLHMWYWYIRL